MTTTTPREMSDPEHDYAHGFQHGLREGTRLAAEWICADSEAILAIRMPIAAGLFVRIGRAVARAYPEATCRQLGDWMVLSHPPHSSAPEMRDT